MTGSLVQLNGRRRQMPFRRGHSCASRPARAYSLLSSMRSASSTWISSLANSSSANVSSGASARHAMSFAAQPAACAAARCAASRSTNVARTGTGLTEIHPSLSDCRSICLEAGEPGRRWCPKRTPRTRPRATCPPVCASNPAIPAATARGSATRRSDSRRTLAADTPAPDGRW